jgi:hypothetical protein
VRVGSVLVSVFGSFGEEEFENKFLKEAVFLN